MKKLMSLFIIAGVAFACTDDDIRSEHTLDNGPKIVGFSNEFETVSYFTDEGDVTLNFPIDLIGTGTGEQLSSAVEISYEVDNAATTVPATQGVEYDFADATGKVTIPAGGSFATLPIVVHTGSLNPTQKTELVIKLTSATNNTVIGEQYKTFKVIFVGCQSQLAGSYTVVITRSDSPAVVTWTDEDITMTSVNNFRSKRSGNYQIGVLQGTNGYKFVDICGEITVPQMNLNDVYSNLLRPDPANNGLDGEVTGPNNFYTKYQIGFTNNTVWRGFTCTYTRNL